MTIQSATIIHNFGLPVDVAKDVDKLWEDMELGNDYYYFPWDYIYDEDYPALAKFIKDNETHNEFFGGIILIHNSW